MSKRPRSSPEDVKIGEKIRESRKAAGLTQKDLAKHVKLSIQQIQKYESGKNSISLFYMEKINDLIKDRSKKYYEQEYMESIDLSSDASKYQTLLEIFELLTNTQQEALKNFLLAMINPEGAVPDKMK